MPMCAVNVPPMYRTEPSRAAACFVYRDSPMLGPGEVSQVLEDSVSAAPAAAG